MPTPLPLPRLALKLEHASCLAKQTWGLLQDSIPSLSPESPHNHPIPSLKSVSLWAAPHLILPHPVPLTTTWQDLRTTGARFQGEVGAGERPLQWPLAVSPMLGIRTSGLFPLVSCNLVRGSQEVRRAGSLHGGQSPSQPPRRCRGKLAGTGLGGMRQGRRPLFGQRAWPRKRGQAGASGLDGREGRDGQGGAVVTALTQGCRPGGSCPRSVRWGCRWSPGGTCCRAPGRSGGWAWGTVPRWAPC